MCVKIELPAIWKKPRAHTYTPVIIVKLKVRIYNLKEQI